jgi:Cu(I)/Ag(I) efflux system membrane protein CusA/SilA
MAVENAVGGEDITTALIGRERYPVNVRYARDFRSNLTSLGRVLVPAAGDKELTVSELADIGASSGPAMIRNEDGLATGYVYIDIGQRDLASYVEEADALLKHTLTLPPGYNVSWSGQFEAIQRVQQHLKVVLPLTCMLIVILLYMNTRSVPKTLIVLLAVPFSAVGAVWCLYLAGYNMSVGVWIGIIALLGVDAETGVFMLLYLDLAYGDAVRRGQMNSLADLQEAIVHGAAKRLRPKFMTFATMCIGLFPILWATGPGSDVMKRIVAPMVGGIFTSFLLELLVYPAIYQAWKWRQVRKLHPVPEQNTAADDLAAVG